MKGEEKVKKRWVKECRKGRTNRKNRKDNRTQTSGG